MGTSTRASGFGGSVDGESYRSYTSRNRTTDYETKDNHYDKPLDYLSRTPKSDYSA